MIFVLLGVLVVSGAFISFLGVMIAEQFAQNVQERQERLLDIK